MTNEGAGQIVEGIAVDNAGHTNFTSGHRGQSLTIDSLVFSRTPDVTLTNEDTDQIVEGIAVLRQNHSRQNHFAHNYSAT